MDGQPGGDSLERRLQRAEALAPEERTPEAAAFVASTQLAAAIRQLLPLGADGRAALPDTPAIRERALLAAVKVGQAAAAAVLAGADRL